MVGLPMVGLYAGMSVADACNGIAIRTREPNAIIFFIEVNPLKNVVNVFKQLLLRYLERPERGANPSRRLPCTCRIHCSLRFVRKDAWLDS
jgi:hypothetical protein